MINFNVGPSKVYPAIQNFLQEAYETGILGLPHRSQEFMDMMKKVIFLLKQKLQIPPQYTIIFASSATECWEILAQSLVVSKSYHLLNGAFGEKWYQYTHYLHRKSEKHVFEINDSLDVERIQTFFTFAERRSGKAELEDKALICFTQNETSNGTQVPLEIIKQVQENFPKQLIAVDATSSMAGIEFAWQNADIWYASVQKCFGLPAGLAIMVLSEKAVARVYEIGEHKHYNSLLKLCEQIQKFQTTHTPNVLGLYLLMRVMENNENIKDIDKKIRIRAENWYRFFEKHPYFRPLIHNEKVRSSTVIALQGKPERIAAIKEKAKQAGFRLGNGYDKWKENTFRIANFPAISEQEIKQLQDFFLQTELE
ncbi:MAG: aminotransferase class V-fold PLP-dependent enzyme [Raineya sp.]|nr:aminotransferase class V-fold PLP-dependent enzyme [Raineya sp.]